MVEYIMLLGVVLVLVLTVLKNPKFKEMMGPNSTLFDGMRQSMMYSYRHGRRGATSADTTDNGYGGNHETFTNSSGSASRFFTNDAEYPAP